MFTMDDPVIQEMREIKDQLASDFDYDLWKIFADILRKEKVSGRKIVNRGKEKDRNLTGETAERADSSAVPETESKKDFGQEFA